MKITLDWNERLKFQAHNSAGHRVDLDAYQAVGGDGSALRPKELMLASLAGCTAMDVLSILKKMRVEPESCRVEVEAQQTDQHPKVFTAFHIRYLLRGAIPSEKLEKAINLSQDRYCGVTAMYRSFAEVTYDYQIEG